MCFTNQLFSNQQADAWQYRPQGLALLGQAFRGQPYGSNAVNAYGRRPGELDKLAEIELQLADCRARRKAAILKVSRITRYDP